MDPVLLTIAARSAERIIGVLIGGLAVYYGFRLFLLVPLETRSDGKIELPGVSVVLAKAGPGLFFAAFGVLVVVASMMNSTTLENGVTTYQGVMANTPLAAVPRPLQSAGGELPSAQDLARVRLAIQTLNCIERNSRSGAWAIPASDVEVVVRDAKLALLASVWDEKAWGDRDTFRRWASGTAGSAAGPARMVFEAERADCTRG